MDMGPGGSFGILFQELLGLGQVTIVIDIDAKDFKLRVLA
jgi:hypothetical protein